MHSDRYSFLMSLALAMWVLVSSFTINTVLPVRAVHAQTMDYNLSQAIRAADSIGSSLQRLQPNDVNGATRLQQKLDKAASLLQTSESTAHPDYQPTVDRLAARNNKRISWIDADLVGSLEPNGEVWRGSNQVGLIEEDGTVWINSNPTGEIEPFQGEWKRAAIIYYFTDFFVSR